MKTNRSLRRPAPWQAGLQAARANAIPALFIQLLMVGVLLAYYFYPPTTRWLDHLAELKARWGYGYSFVAAIIAGALFPEFMRVAGFQKFRPERRNFANLLFTIPFWGVMGMTVDAFYRFQAFLFGSSNAFHVVATKVAFDQCVYTAFFATPLTCWLYDWKHARYRLAQPRQLFTLSYYRETCLPVLIANWAVWIPIVSVIYSLPDLLQIPLFALALSLWVTLYTWISENKNTPT